MDGQVLTSEDRKDIREFLLRLRDRGFTIRLSGDDLVCRSSSEAIPPRIVAEIKARKSAIVTFLRDVLPRRQRLLLQPAPSKQNIPVAFSQETLWYLHYFKPQNIYNSARGWRLRGAVDVDALQHALDEVARRYESFRTRYTLSGNLPVQSVFELPTDEHVELIVHDLRERPRGEQEEHLARLIRETADRRFDLEGDILMRAALIRLGDESSMLVFAAHELLYDGRSVDLVVTALNEFYAAHVGQRAPCLAPLEATYLDFAHSLRHYIDAAVLALQQAYWANLLSRRYRLLRLPRQTKIAAERPCITTLRTMTLESAMGQGLVAQARAFGASVNVLMLALTKLHLGLLTGQDDVMVYSYVSLRTVPALHEEVGLFTNILIFRTVLANDPTLAELADQVRSMLSEALSHQELRLAEQVSLLDIDPEQSHICPFQICYVFVNEPVEQVRISGVEVEPVHVGRYAFFDLITHVTQRGDAIDITYEYRDDVYQAAQIEAMMRRFEALVERLLEQPDHRLSGLQGSLGAPLFPDALE